MGTYNHCLIEDQVERFFGASGKPETREQEDYVTPQVQQQAIEREKELIMLRKQIQQATQEKRKRTQEYLQGQSNIEKAKELERRQNIQLKANKIREEYANNTQQVAYIKEEAKLLKMRQKMDKDKLDKINRLTQQRQMALPQRQIPTSGNVNIPAAPTPIKPKVTPSSALAPNPHLPFPVQPQQPPQQQQLPQQQKPPQQQQPSQPQKPPQASPEIPPPSKQKSHDEEVEDKLDEMFQNNYQHCRAAHTVYEYMDMAPREGIDPHDEFEDLYRMVVGKDENKAEDPFMEFIYFYLYNPYSAQTLERAKRRLSLELHPDKNKGCGKFAERAFKYWTTFQDELNLPPEDRNFEKTKRKFDRLMQDPDYLAQFAEGPEEEQDEESDEGLEGGSFMEPEFLKKRPLKMNKFLETYGDEKIAGVQACRRPISKVYQNLLNLVTRGDLKKKMMEMKYDDLYHLYLVVYLENGDSHMLELNERVNIAENFEMDEDVCTQIDDISDKEITLREFVERGEQSNPNLYHYNVVSNNCQVFVRSLLNANGINRFNTFVMQNVKKLIPSYLKSLLMMVTNLGAAANYIKSGGGY